MTTTSYKVTGMSCEHCVNAVTSELRRLDGVSAVTVELVPDGVSLVTVTSAQPWQTTRSARRSTRPAATTLEGPDLLAHRAAQFPGGSLSLH